MNIPEFIGRRYMVMILAGVLLFMIGFSTLTLTVSQIADELDFSDFKQPITVGYLLFGLGFTLIGFAFMYVGTKQWEKNEKLDREIKERTKEKLDLEKKKIELEIKQLELNLSKCKRSK